jgi:hypothetical protein
VGADLRVGLEVVERILADLAGKVKAAAGVRLR